ncbi:hypothetical protein RRG08_018831, partial [Elysia crispata]
DDTFKHLQDCFLHSARGRPKSLSSNLPITNKLHVQLWYLQVEGKKPWTVIDDWLSKLECQTWRGHQHHCTTL